MSQSAPAGATPGGAPPPAAAGVFGPSSGPGPLESALRRRRAEGAKLLVPYVTGGLGEDWPAVIEAVVAAGADAVEVGIPFSDPVIDGPVIQEASAQALAAGATPGTVIDALGRLRLGAPMAVMTYYNLIFRGGHRRMASLLAEAGVAGAILPDLPLDESEDWAAAADHFGVETVMLAAPTTSDARLAAICERSRGFVYGIGLMGVTGQRTALAASASIMAKRLKAVTDKPVLIGVGISSPAQAVEVCQEADGVAVGSALVRRLLDGGGPEGAAELVGQFRAALDAG
ncbi:MAG TPA: tryptophan synthase subunit alpha [Acidimicrobiales bacterium]|nr:tryptophan synthase subunit alpha [Acidimicrobiales bacterium]